MESVLICVKGRGRCGEVLGKVREGVGGGKGRCGECGKVLGVV